MAVVAGRPRAPPCGQTAALRRRFRIHPLAEVWLHHCLLPRGAPYDHFCMAHRAAFCIHLASVQRGRSGFTNEGNVGIMLLNQLELDHLQCLFLTHRQKDAGHAATGLDVDETSPGLRSPRPACSCSAHSRRCGRDRRDKRGGVLTRLRRRKKPPPTAPS